MSAENVCPSANLAVTQRKGDGLVPPRSSPAREAGRGVLDLVREVRPPFSPDAVVEEFCVVLKSYGIHRVVLDVGGWKVLADVVDHGNGVGFSPAFLKRWICYGYRVEAEGKVVTISGDTVACEGIDRLAKSADVLVHCCYMGSAEAETAHFRRLLQYTMAGGDTVGKIAARAGVKTLVLTHHRPRKDDSALQVLADEVARDFLGKIVVGKDLMEVEV